MLSFLDAGEELIKFGRHGSPKAKWVNVTRGRLFWVPSILGRTPSNSKAPTFIMLVDVKGVVAGKVTHVFKRPVAKGIPQANCFSVITDYRTLDFQARCPFVRFALCYAADLFCVASLTGSQ